MDRQIETSPMGRASHPASATNSSTRRSLATEQSETHPSRRMSVSQRGIIYVVTGRRHAEEACRSATMAKQCLPDLPISIFTDQPIDAPVFDQVVAIPQASGFLSKVVHIRQSPYRDSLFLDSDTHVIGDIRPLFELLERFDIAATHAPYRTTYRIAGVPDCFPEFNTGVLLYRRNDKTNLLWDHWIRLYTEDLSRPLEWDFPGGEQWFRDALSDQPSFRHAVYQSDVAVATLPPEYNCRIIFPGALHTPVKIIHGRSTNLARDILTLNQTDLPRVHLMRWGRLTTLHSAMPPADFQSSLWWSLHNRGLFRTVQVAVQRIISHFIR